MLPLCFPISGHSRFVREPPDRIIANVTGIYPIRFQSPIARVICMFNGSHGLIIYTETVLKRKDRGK